MLRWRDNRVDIEFEAAKPLDLAKVPLGMRRVLG